MPTFGTDQGGFSVEHGSVGVRVRAWGFWDGEASTAFPNAVVEHFRSMRAPGDVLFDASELKPQREEGQAAFRKLVTEMGKLERVRVRVTVTNAITRLQLVRIAKECGAQGWSFEASNDSPGT